MAMVSLASEAHAVGESEYAFREVQEIKIIEKIH